METWRPIPGQEGYEASDAGRIRSVDRFVTRTYRDGRVVRQFFRGAVLSPAKCKNGYLYVHVNRKSRQVHRLVAMAWVPGYMPRLDASHVNNNRHDNRPDNLRWKTRKDNIGDQIEHGTRLRGERQNGAKLRESDVIKMRECRLSGVSWANLGKMFGVATMTAKNAVTGLTWKHVQEQP